MAATHEINRLKQQIRELAAEILNLKKLLGPNMPIKEYKKIHADFLSLTNLKAIAKNELEASLYQYKIVLCGKSNNANNGYVEKVFRGKFKSEINCRLFASRNLDVSIQSHNEMYKYIAEHYSGLFIDKKFKIRSVMQLK